MELEDEHKQLGFLDVMSRNNLNGKYEFKIHRKDAITNVQTKPHSSINPNIISGIFKGFLVRAARICSKKFLLDEINFLVDMFVENGHNRSDLETIAKPFRNMQPQQPNQLVKDPLNKPIVKLPWIPVLSTRLRRALKNDFRVIFTSGPDLTKILCNHKSKLPKNSQPGVYEVNCGCGKRYIGETKKKISTRVNEHQKDIFHGRWENTGASEHARDCTEEYRWEESKTIAVESKWHPRKIREALVIRMTQREGSIISNRDNGNLKTKQWDALLGKLAN